MSYLSSEILEVLDAACPEADFPMMDNGYFYPAATRLSLFRDEEDWALVIEIFGYSPREGLPSIHIFTFGSRLVFRAVREDYVSEEAYQNYLKNRQFNEFSVYNPIEEGEWIDDDSGVVADEGSLVLRDVKIPLPPLEGYIKHGVQLENDLEAEVIELCRYLASTHRDQVLATTPELRYHVPSELSLILQLDEWQHPDLLNDELPSMTESFQMLAKVLETGDVTIYRPQTRPNTHWSHWPEAGTL